MKSVEKSSVERKENFSQVCVWEGTSLGQSLPADVEKFFADAGFRVQYLENILTNPDLDELGRPVPETGGRDDMLIAVHNDDIPKFAMARFHYGIRWIEDVTSRVNRGDHLYPEYVKSYNSSFTEEQIENKSL